MVATGIEIGELVGRQPEQMQNRGVQVVGKQNCEARLRSRVEVRCDYEARRRIRPAPKIPKATRLIDERTMAAGSGTALITSVGTIGGGSSATQPRRTWRMSLTILPFN